MGRRSEHISNLEAEVERLRELEKRLKRLAASSEPRVAQVATAVLQGYFGGNW